MKTRLCLVAFAVSVGLALAAVVYSASVAAQPSPGSPALDTLGIDDAAAMIAAPFEDSGTTLTGVSWSSVAWGDYDNDGDLDILLAGHTGVTATAKVYRNEGGDIFTDTAIGLVGVSGSSSAWGDYDNDNDLDILLTGAGIAQIYRNEGNDSFTDIDAGLAVVKDGGTVAWGDYDNDGDLDIVLAGNSLDTPIAKIYRNDGSGIFTDIGVGLPGIYHGSAAWGDYDNDGDLDLLLVGHTVSERIASVYRNDLEGGFTDIKAGLTGISPGTVAWGDYDNDGDLDILLAGRVDANTYISKLYQNANGVFIDTGIALTGTWMSSTAWGDYDNDGDLDILMTGATGPQGSYNPIAQVYQNGGGNSFTDINAGLSGVTAGSIAWGDYDNDGDLDILLAGQHSSGVRIAKIYRNTITATNTTPFAPLGLAASVIDTAVRLSWDTASDAQTVSKTLTYNLRVGTTPGGSDIVSPMTITGTGYRQVPRLGNAGHNLAMLIQDLVPGATYYWSVQTIDTAWVGSPFASELSFTVPALPAVQISRSLSAEVVVWNQVYPITLPAARLAQAMAYDSARKRVVLFGGAGSDIFGDTWQWNGVDWIQSFPTTTLSARYWHAMTCDDTRERIVLFGGVDRNGAYLDETWEWNGSYWTRFFPTVSPGARKGSTMVYDSTHGRVILFGGYDGNNWLNDIWEWDGSNWTERNPVHSPLARAYHALVYDQARGVAVLFGGWHDGYLSDTWEWNGTDWVQRFPAISPIARYAHALTYDSVRGSVFLFGGSGSSGYLNDNWEWDGIQWGSRVSAVSPSARSAYALAYDSVRETHVLFGGGVRSTSFNDTWECGIVRLVISPTVRALAPDQVVAFDVWAEGWATPITLTVSGVPLGVSSQFYPSSVITPPALSTLRLARLSTTLDGVYPITITAHLGSQIVTLPVTLSVETLDFGLALTSSPWSIYPGTITTHGIAITSTAVFTQPVAIKITGLPASIESTLSSNPALPNSIVDLQLAAPLSTTPGIYGLVITGSATILSDTIPIPLTRTTTTTLIVLPSTITPTISPGVDIYQGQSTSYTIMVQATPGLTQPATLALDGLDDMTATFWPNPVPLGQATTLVVTTMLDTAPGTRLFTVTASSHNITRTIQPELLVLPAALTLSVMPSSRAIYQEQVTTYVITAEATPGFTLPVTLAVDNLDDLAYTFSSNPVFPGEATALVLTTTMSFPSGTRVFTITASGGGLSGTTQAELIVLPAIITPSVTPSSRTIYQDQSTVYTITVDATPGFDQPITLDMLGLSSLSPAVEYVLSPTQVLPGGEAVLALTTFWGSLSIAGTFPFTVTASSGALSGTAYAELTLLPAGITVTIAPSSRTVYQGQVTTYTVSTLGTPGLKSATGFFLLGLDDASYTFGTVALPVGQSVTLTVSTTLGTAPISHPITVVAGLRAQHFGSPYAELIVLPANITPTVSPASRTIYRGQVARFTVNVARTPGFTLPVGLELGNLPAGASWSSSPTLIPTSGSAVLLVTTTATTPLGIHQFTITTTSAHLVRSVQATLDVRVAVYLPLIAKRWPPVPYSPSLNAIQGADDGEYLVSWTEAPARLADTYTLQEATDAAFTTGLLDVCTTAQQSCTVSGKLAGTYYYRVRGHNTWGYGDWSNVQAATVLLPDVPVLNPIDNADDDGSYTVTWNAAVRAASYVLEEDISLAFSNPTSVYSGPGRSWSAADKTSGIYHYRVRAVGPTGQSGWSGVQSAVVGGIEDVYVLSSSVYESSGYLYVVGEVLNNTSRNVNDIEVNVTFYNAQGGVVGTGQGSAYMGGWSWEPPLAPGQKSPFRITFWSDLPVGWSSYRFVVTYRIASQALSSGLRVLNVTTRQDGETYHIYGEIQNDTSGSMESVEAVATLYDAAGKVINVGSSSTNPSSLPPGEKGSFHLSFEDNLAGLAVHVLQPYGSSSSSSILTGLPVLSSAIFGDSWEDLYLVGEVLNNTSNNINDIEINVTFYNADGGVVGTDQNSTYIGGWSWDPPLAPGQKSPFRSSLWWDPPVGWSSYRFVVTYQLADEPPMSGLEILNVTTRQDGGTYHIYGEIRNNTSGSIESIQSLATLYDAAGKVINAASTSANPSALPSGEKGSFHLSFSNNLAGLALYILQPYGSPASSPVLIGLPVLSNSIYRDSWDDPYLVGEVLNNTGSNVNDVEINVTFYNADGGVVGTNSTSAYIGGWSWESSLAPGQKSPFHISLWLDEPVGWSSYTFVVVYQVTDEPPISSLQAKNVTTRYDNSGYYHVLGEIQNNGAGAFSYVEAVITLYDGTGRVINCGTDSTNPSTLNPGQTGAFDASFRYNLSSLASYAVQAFGDPQ